MFKFVFYENWARTEELPRDGVVVYVIFGNICIFTGVTPPILCTSTANAAEEIMEAIGQKEGINRKWLRFFDLQTHHGYPDKRPGEFVLDEVLTAADGSLTWDSCECPEELRNLFRDYIGTCPFPNGYRHRPVTSADVVIFH